MHRHIEFDLELGQVIDKPASSSQKGNSYSSHSEKDQSHVKMIDSAARGFEDSIFAELAPGLYYL